MNTSDSEPDFIISPNSILSFKSNKVKKPKSKVTLLLSTPHEKIDTNCVTKLEETILSMPPNEIRNNAEEIIYGLLDMLKSSVNQIQQTDNDDLLIAKLEEGLSTHDSLSSDSNEIIEKMSIEDGIKYLEQGLESSSTDIHEDETKHKVSKSVQIPSKDKSRLDQDVQVELTANLTIEQLEERVDRWRNLAKQKLLDMSYQLALAQKENNHQISAI